MLLERIKGYLWALLGVAAATVCFWLLRHYLDKGQASLLYLPIVIACAIRFGFGPAILGAIGSFLCWDFFFLPPFFTFIVNDPKDWLSLFVFLLAALTTAHLASRAREQTQQATAREAEIAMLFEASESLSHEISSSGILSALIKQLQALCDASSCHVFQYVDQQGLLLVAGNQQDSSPMDAEREDIWQMAHAAYERRQVIGFGDSQNLWKKALGSAHAPELGVYIPLEGDKSLVGVLHVSPRSDGRPFSKIDERLILTLANHAAVVIARENLAAEAAQAQALREADILKDSLLSLVSHELRTPLAAIKATASGLLQPDAHWAEEERLEALSAINTEADRLSRLVSNLLDLSRIEAGAWLPNKEWCDMGDIVGTALDTFSETDAERIRIKQEAQTPLVRVDYLQIVLVLNNLIGNAFKYAPTSPQIELTIMALHNGQDESASGVIVSVRDFGKGIEQGEEAHLFDRFTRGRIHADSAIHGTGLGLALCRAIVQAHAGHIWASSASPDESPGAVFTFTLPA